MKTVAVRAIRDQHLHGHLGEVRTEIRSPLPSDTRLRPAFWSGRSALRTGSASRLCLM